MVSINRINMFYTINYTTTSVYKIKFLTWYPRIEDKITIHFRGNLDGRIPEALIYVSR